MLVGALRLRRSVLPVGRSAAAPGRAAARRAGRGGPRGVPGGHPDRSRTGRRDRRGGAAAASGGTARGGGAALPPAGFDNVSTDQLGAAVGISGPSVYRHFESKQQLLAASLVRSRERLWHEVEGRSPPRPGRRRRWRPAWRPTWASPGATATTWARC
ncbi:helix-turn-helix domain-containing protein [Kitasatospora aburaviensis]